MLLVRPANIPAFFNRPTDSGRGIFLTNLETEANNTDPTDDPAPSPTIQSNNESK